MRIHACKGCAAVDPSWDPSWGQGPAPTSPAGAETLLKVCGPAPAPTPILGPLPQPLPLSPLPMSGFTLTWQATQNRRPRPLDSMGPISRMTRTAGLAADRQGHLFRLRTVWPCCQRFSHLTFTVTLGGSRTGLPPEELPVEQQPVSWPRC